MTVEAIETIETIENIKVGDAVVIKSLSRWSDNFQRVDDQYFQAGFVHADGIYKGMEEHIGRSGQVVHISDYGKEAEIEIDFTFMNQKDCFVWDLHSIERILSKEEFPEYYL